MIRAYGRVVLYKKKHIFLWSSKIPKGNNKGGDESIHLCNIWSTIVSHAKTYISLICVDFYAALLYRLDEYIQESTC
jgi:hypothetical protein